MIAGVACQSGDKEQTQPTTNSEVDAIYVASLSPANQSGVSGTVKFSSESDGTVLVSAVVSGLESGGRFGFHVHEFGDCSAPDASSAGGHYNPLGSPHGAPGNPASERHAGDLGNLEELAEGVAEFESVDSVLRLTGEQSIEGKAVIVHSGADDFVTQPTGNAGKRLACGVIARKVQ